MSKSSPQTIKAKSPRADSTSKTQMAYELQLPLTSQPFKDVWNELIDQTIGREPSADGTLTVQLDGKDLELR